MSNSSLSQTHTFGGQKSKASRGSKVNLDINVSDLREEFKEILNYVPKK